MMKLRVSRSIRFRASLVLFAALLLTLAGAAEAGAAAGPITVTNANDSGPGSLRQTIADAPAGATIAVPAGTYSLTSGEIAIAKSLTITGAGAPITIVRAGTPSRIFHTSGAGSTITISGLTVRDGNPQVTGTGHVNGGGVLNDDAMLALNDDVIVANHADADGLGTTGSGGVASGGGIFNGMNGALRLVRTSVLSNRASANGSPGHGGGIADGGGVAGDGALTMIASTLSDNTAEALGGQGPASANQFGSIAEGGGLSTAPDHAVSIAASTFDHNVADSSGGPGGNGGITEGGGAFMDTNEDPISLVNDTFFADIARTSSGGSTSAGALFAGSNGGAFSLTNTTITNGSALGGRSNTGGDLAFGNSPVNVENTLVTAGVADLGSQNCSGAPMSLGHNLESLDQCGFHAAGDLVNANPLLGPLQDDGGPAPTIALGTGSPAIDRGAGAHCPTTDARGALRPAGLGCDIGAFEVATPGATTGQASSIDSSSAVLGGSAFNPDVSEATAFFQYGTTTAYGSRTPDVTVSAAVSAAQVTAPVTQLAPATTYHFRVVIVNSVGTAFGGDQTFTTRPASALPPPPARPRIAKLAIHPGALSSTRGATVSYADTQRATTTFVEQRSSAGRLEHGSCVRSTRRNRTLKPCVRWVSVGRRFTQADAPGLNRFRLTIRSSGPRLTRGNYRLVATPRTGGLTGNTLSATFRVIALARGQ
jgi:hypothetical protein